jgi:ABC-type multidrug transport system, ATPase and permease components
MLRTLRYLDGRQWGHVLVVLGLVLVQVWLDLLLPDFMATITTLAETAGSRMEDILLQGACMVLCALGSMAATIAATYVGNRVAAGFAKTLRAEVFDHALTLSKGDVDRFGAGSLVNRCTNDITQIQTLVSMGLSAIIKAPIMVVWAAIKIVGYGWQWTAATVVAATSLVIVLGITMAIAVPRYQRVQGLTDDINRLIREHLQGIRPIHAYNAEQYEQDRLDVTNDDITRTQTVATRATAVIGPILTLESSALTLAIYWLGAGMVQAAAPGTSLSVFSEMVVFSNYAIQVIMSFMLLSMVFILYPRAAISARRVMEVIETEPTVKDGGGVTRQGEVGTVEFRDVSFSYPDDGARALSHVSFKVEKGQTVAFIGATGSGKTTLVQLVVRLFDATEGSVLVDGQDVRDYTCEQLHERVGYVPQTATLFKGTVASNVSYGETDHEITRADVEDAIAISQSTGFVEAMDGSYDAPIEQGGRNVSGGQRQRLAISRALARKPEILVFDDSFSALDFATDRSLRSELAKRRPDTTYLIVAQRVSTIRDADQIVVLDHGEVVGKGTHDQLMGSCAAYQEIVSSQLSKEEIAHV